MKGTERQFSEKLVLVYTCIVLIPLLCFFVYVMSFTISQKNESYFESSEDFVQEDVQIVHDNIKSINLMNSMIVNNDALMLFLTIPENCEEGEIIETTKSEVTTVERILSVTSLYAVRIFIENNLVPERWPVFLHMDRTDLSNVRSWEFDYSATYMGNQEGLKTSSVCITRRLEKSKRFVGYLQICMEMKDFFPFLYKKKNSQNNDYIFRIDDSGLNRNLEPVVNDEILKYNAPMSGEWFERFRESFYSTKGYRYADIRRQKIDRTFFTWKVVPELDLVILHTFCTGQMQLSFYVTVLIAILSLIVSALLLFGLIKYSTRKMLRGVYSLIYGMEKVRKGNYDVQIEISSDDEFGETQKTFNSMTKQIKSQISQIKEEQQLIADTQMKAMQNQINAHFLYNVLETIRMQAVLNEQDDIEESIIALGKMMRYCLRWKVHTVDLVQEMEYIEHYIYILNIRNDYVITLENKIEEKHQGLKIPKMLLQPVVENSFIHGIEPLAQDSVVRIFTKIPEDRRGVIYLCVQDFGIGMNEEQVNNLRSYIYADKKENENISGNIGVKNIQQRLFMFYGNDFKILIESEMGKGTLVMIPVPYEK